MKNKVPYQWLHVCAPCVTLEKQVGEARKHIVKVQRLIVFGLHGENDLFRLEWLQHFSDAGSLRAAEIQVQYL
jgi:hypothetical protein